MNITEYIRITTIFELFFFILIGIVIICVLATFNSHTRKGSIIGKITLAGLFVCLFIDWTICMNRNDVIDNYRASQGYHIFLDGKEVEPDTVDIALYRKSYDDEHKRIFLSSAGRR